MPAAKLAQGDTVRRLYGDSGPGVVLETPAKGAKRVQVEWPQASVALLRSHTLIADLVKEES